MRTTDPTNPNAASPGLPPPVKGRRLARLLMTMGTMLLIALATAASAGAHAELASSVPAADAVVEAAPLTLELTFTEEVAADGLAIRVLGPDGDEVQASTPELDLNDVERRRVTLSLQANLPDGRYTVEWEVASNLDAHIERGTFAFFVGQVPSSPVASPAGSPVSGLESSSPVASSARLEATLEPNANGNPLSTEEDTFDGQGFGISVGVGLIGVAVLALFWRAVRPRNPRFGGRARG